MKMPPKPKMLNLKCGEHRIQYGIQRQPDDPKFWMVTRWLKYETAWVDQTVVADHMSDPRKAKRQMHRDLRLFRS